MTCIVLTSSVGFVIKNCHCTWAVLGEPAFKLLPSPKTNPVSRHQQWYTHSVILNKCLADWCGWPCSCTSCDIQQHESICVPVSCFHDMTDNSQESYLIVWLSFHKFFQLLHIFSSHYVAHKMISVSFWCF